MAQVINFHDAQNDQLNFPGVGYEELYAGQGAYSDPGNNIWNGFGYYEGYNSTFFYSAGPGGAQPWPQPAGNPGNPYANYNNGPWTGDYAWNASTGTNLFVMTGYFPSPQPNCNPTYCGNVDSSGNWTPITLQVLGYDGDNGIDNILSFRVPNGTPGFLLGEMAYRNGDAYGGGTEMQFDLVNVPTNNVYGLYLYGANYPDNRGTLFGVSTGGTAHNGIAATLNGLNGKPASTFVEGQNFVIFENVTPDEYGYISIVASANPQDGVGNINSTNEACVNGFQLIFNPPPTAVAPTAAQNVLAGGTANFSFSPAFASNPSFRWQSIIGGVTTPLSDGGNISGSRTTNLTVANVTSANVGLYQCVITTATATNTSPLAPLTIVSSTLNRSLQAGDPTTLLANVLQPGDTLADLSPTTAAQITPEAAAGVGGGNAAPRPDGLTSWNTIPPPWLMTVTNVEDGTLRQWENFGSNLDAAPFQGPVGFVVTPKIGLTVLKGLRLFTASSHPEDDPADYLLEGSTDGGVTFTTIAGGLLALPAQRNASDGPINVANQVLQEIDFANTAAYTTYRVTFTNVSTNVYVNGGASNGVQVAEVQLLGSLAAVLPGIVQQPETQVLLAGATFHASVVPSGPGPLGYQWYSNGTLMAGATTATLTVANLQTTSGGGPFTCVLSNSTGSITSAPASLTVVAPTAYDALVLADQPLAYYRLSETGGTTAYDYVGGYNGTYLNSPGLNQPGPSSAVPASVLFDGTSQSVSIPASPALEFAGDITLEAWVQPNAVLNTSTCGNIIAKGYDNSQCGETTIRVTQGTPSYFYGGQWGYGGGGITAGLVTEYPLTWYHVVLTYETAAPFNGYWKLYVDSQLVGTVQDWIGVLNYTDPWAIGTGTADGTNRFYAGNITAAAIYNHALTAAEVTAHFLAAGPPVITAPPQSTVVIAGSNVTLSVTAIGAPPLSYQWYNSYPYSGSLIAGATTSTLTLTNVQPSANAYYVIVTGTGGLAVTNAQPGAVLTVLTTTLPGSYFSSVVGLNPLAYWPLNETTPVAPAVPAHNIGTMGAAGNANYPGSGVTLGVTGALPGAATNLAITTDGSTGNVVLPFSPALETKPPFTVEAWLNAADLYNSSTPGCALACVDAGNPRSGWLLYMGISGSGYWTFRTYNQNGLTSSISQATAVTVGAGQWHYVAAVVSTNASPANTITVTMYLDGTNSSTSGTATYIPNDAGNFTIGSRSDNGFYFNGTEDEVAYYTNALSASDISNHYAVGTNTTPTTPYYQVVLADNPQLFYELNELSIYPDESTEPFALNYGATGSTDNGYYLTGTVPGGAPGPNVAGFPATGSNNVAVHFNSATWASGSASGNTLPGGGSPGVAGFVDVPVDPAMNVLGASSVAAWAQANFTPGRSAYEDLAGRGDPSIRLQIANSVFGEYGGSALLQYGAGGASVNGIPPAGVLNDGKWHFIVGTWDGSTTCSLYVDGILNATNGPLSPPQGDDQYDFTIGNAPDAGNRVFDGNIAQVAVFAYALSPAQVQSLYYSAEVAPFISQEPPASLEEPAGANVMIAVTANGTPTLTYQWRKGGLPVSGGEYSGANTPALLITGAGTNDAGLYTVAVSNSYGAVTSSPASLTVGAGAPVVVTDISPLVVATPAGVPVTFAVEAVGTETLYYQWMLDGAAIVGATTSSYTFNALPGTNSYRLSISNSMGSTFSSTAVVETYIGYPNTTNPPPLVGFNGNGADWTLNQGAGWPGRSNTPSISNNVLTLTDGFYSEGSSAFYNTPQYISSFIAAFTYQEAPGNAPLADGVTFCLQNAADGPEAVGAGGGGLGYYGIMPSAALELNIFSGANGGVGIQFGTEGSDADAESVPPVGSYMSTAPLNLASGDRISVLIYYSGNVAKVSLSDATATNSFSTTFNLTNLPAIVGSGSGSTAYVGFTGGTGALDSIQTISNFAFSYTTTMTPSLSVAHGAPGSVVISWPVGVSPLFVLQQTTALNGTWSNVGGTPAVVGGENQVTLTPATATFFRLSLQP